MGLQENKESKMPLFEFNWKASVEGSAAVESPDEATARSFIMNSVGGGISIAAQLHKPPGVKINLEMQLKNSTGIVVPSGPVNITQLRKGG